METKKQTGLTALKGLMQQNSVKEEFKKALGERAGIFMSNLATIVGGSAALQKCEPITIVSAALMSTGVDLPITPGLGFAAIVPYKNYATNTYQAQFQIMKKGYIQLAQRTGLVQLIHCAEVFDGELISYNKFTGEYTFDEKARKSDLIIGYVAYMKLTNGFEKYNYMSIKECENHARKYSQSYRIKKGKWADNDEGGFEQMCAKTVIKLLLSNYGPLSADTKMQKSLMYDQAIQVAIGDENVIYPDNPGSETDPAVIIEEEDAPSDLDIAISDLANAATNPGIDAIIASFPDLANEPKFTEAVEAAMGRISKPDPKAESKAGKSTQGSLL